MQAYIAAMLGSKSDLERALRHPSVRTVPNLRKAVQRGLPVRHPGRQVSDREGPRRGSQYSTCRRPVVDANSGRSPFADRPGCPQNESAT